MSSESIVKLNVGGSIFQTSKSTLTKFDGFFKTILETGVPTAKDESGAIFIDRDPAHFRLILNFMRDGHLDLPESSEDVKQIQNEAQYYLLDGLVELCEQKAIENGSTGKPVLIKSLEEKIRALADCKNKGVIILSFRKEHPRRYQASEWWNVQQLLGNDYDVYLEETDHTTSDQVLFEVYEKEKSNTEIFFNHSSWYDWIRRKVAEST